MSAGAAVSDAQRYQHALEVALRYLNKRDRTIAEVRTRLDRDDVSADLSEAVIAELLDQCYLDDSRYAKRFAEDRRTLDAWGADRIARKLQAVGVAEEHIAAAVAGQDAAAELDAAVALLRRRFPEPPADDRSRERALGLLVRRGYELDLAYEAVRALGRGD